MSGAPEAHQPADDRAVAAEARRQAARSATPSRPSVPCTDDQLRSVAGGDSEVPGRHGFGGAGPVLDEAQGGAGDEAAARAAQPASGADGADGADDADSADGAAETAGGPGAGDQAAAPAQGDQAAEPDQGDQAASPDQGDQAAAPAQGDQAAPPDQGDQAGEPDPLVEACRQRDEYLDALRRLQADFENYRKRVQRQQEESVSRAGDRLVLSILPALDAFDLAAAHLVGDDQVSPGGFIQAVALLRDTLAKEGLEQVGSVGDPFDPTAHEAVEHVDDGGEAGPTIDTVLRAGYRFGGRVIRPAMVKVRG